MSLKKFNNHVYFIFKKDENIKLTANFTSSEMKCQCGNSTCEYNHINKDLVDTLQKIREEYGKPITITSGFRCKDHNGAIGGHPNSKHILGQAVDFTGEDLDTLYDLAQKYFNSVGDGRNKGFIHIDVRNLDKPLRWVY